MPIDNPSMILYNDIINMINNTTPTKQDAVKYWVDIIDKLDVFEAQAKQLDFPYRKDIITHQNNLVDLLAIINSSNSNALELGHIIALQLADQQITNMVILFEMHCAKLEYRMKYTN